MKRNFKKGIKRWGIDKMFALMTHEMPDDQMTIIPSAPETIQDGNVQGGSPNRVQMLVGGRGGNILTLEKFPEKLEITVTYPNGDTTGPWTFTE